MDMYWIGARISSLTTHTGMCSSPLVPPVPCSPGLFLPLGGPVQGAMPGEEKP